MPTTQACLDGAASRIQRYGQGEISETEWAETWDCALNSIALFRRYVQPSTPQGYTPEDLRAFTNRFLIRAVPVTPEAMKASFELKAALFGGSADVLREDEFERLRGFIISARSASLNVLPHLVARARRPSPETLLSLADAFSSVGAMLSGALNTHGNQPLKMASLELLLSELARGAGVVLPETFSEQLRAGKVALLSGSAEVVEPDAWASVLRLIAEYSGSYVAAVTATRTKGQQGLYSAKTDTQWSPFWGGLAERVRSPLNLMLMRHRGALPLEVLDRVIDALPEARLRQWLGVPEGRDFERAILKRALRPISHRLLRSKDAGKIDAEAVRGVIDQWQHWHRGAGLLSRMFEEGGLNPEQTSREELKRATLALIERTPGGEDQFELSRWLALSSQYATLFKHDDDQLTYGLGEIQTLNHLKRLHAVEFASRILLRGYASGENGSAKLEDLSALIEDFKELGFSLAYIDPSVGQLAEKRFKEIDLFTLASNGDGLADLREVTYYLLNFLSTRALTARLREKAEANCADSGSRDALGWRWVEANCFRSTYFEQKSEFWDHFPGLLDYSSRATPKLQARLARALEIAARDGSNLETPVASLDTTGFSGITHYVEGLLDRFDVDRNGAIDLPESKRAFPVYKRELAALSNIPLKDHGTLEAVFTYILKRAKPPKKNILGIADFLWWRARTPLWKFSCDRACLYQVFGSFKVPEKSITPRSAAGN